MRPGNKLAVLLGHDEMVADAVAWCLRAAYAQGYSDALQEDRAGRRAELQRAHGYAPE